MPTARSTCKAYRARMVDHALPAALDEACRGLARRVAGDAPVDTGHLRRSVHAVPATLEGSRLEAAVVVLDPIGHLQEFGTIHQAPQPFFRPAIAAGLPAFRQTLTDAR